MVTQAAAAPAGTVGVAPVTVRGDAADDEGAEPVADDGADAADDEDAAVEAGALADDDEDPPDEHPAAAITAAPAATAPPSLSIDEAEPNIISHLLW
ncbi:MAG TPA: hypothetical protein VIZ43_25100 [Trebonia sp.]